jgi:hypothetical protein
LTFANVPTGINLGVCTTPWGVWNTPTRASVCWHSASTVKLKLKLEVELELRVKLFRAKVLRIKHLKSTHGADYGKFYHIIPLQRLALT